MNQTGPVMVIAGTRPEVLKLAPVVAALRHIGVPTTLVATGQHSEILERAFDDVQLQPDVRIDVLHPGQALPALIARVLDGIGALLTAHNYSGVVVQGDTASAFGVPLRPFFPACPSFMSRQDCGQTGSTSRSRKRRFVRCFPASRLATLRPRGEPPMHLCRRVSSLAASRSPATQSSTRS
ncbi:MAG: UDP-N-acetylglucosamine 2-epimerase [Dehalococcoidia bacterium]|nr:UDP-N-acetylglucosamine 2-epimerase [Dehalococcoidia bacterium]MCB9484717.1 UDP-N-acetylglucosamine 2-epimerase [Thermoflexaceae bacterium]